MADFMGYEIISLNSLNELGHYSVDILVEGDPVRILYDGSSFYVSSDGAGNEVDKFSYYIDNSYHLFCVLQGQEARASLRHHPVAKVESVEVSRTGDRDYTVTCFFSVYGVKYFARRLDKSWYLVLDGEAVLGSIKDIADKVVDYLRS